MWVERVDWSGWVWEAYRPKLKPAKGGRVGNKAKETNGTERLRDSGAYRVIGTRRPRQRDCRLQD